MVGFIAWDVKSNPSLVGFSFFLQNKEFLAKLGPQNSYVKKGKLISSNFSFYLLDQQSFLCNNKNIGQGPRTKDHINIYYTVKRNYPNIPKKYLVDPWGFGSHIPVGKKS